MANVIDILFRAQNLDSVQRSVRQLADNFRELGAGGQEAAASFAEVRGAAASAATAIDDVEALQNLDIGIRVDHNVIEDVQSLRKELEEIQQITSRQGPVVPNEVLPRPGAPATSAIVPPTIGPEAASNAEAAAQGMEHLAASTSHADDIIEGLKAQFADLHSRIAVLQNAPPIEPKVDDKDIEAARKKLQDFLNESQRVGKDSSKALQQRAPAGDFKDAATSIAAIGGAVGGALIALRALDAGLSGVKNAFLGVVNAAAAQEQSNARFAAALSSIGQLSVENQRSMGEFANAMQATTQFEDEAVQNTAALIAQLGRLSGEGLQRATADALDMAAALGRGAEEMAVLFGRAATGEVGGFSRLGITVDETLPKAEKFAEVLNRVEQSFGGTAQALAQTYTGSISQMKNAFGELGESIGNLVLPQLTEFAQTTTRIVNSIAGDLGTLRGETNLTVTELVDLFQRQQEAIRGAAPEIRRELESALSTIQNKAVLQIRTEVQRGNLDDVLRTAEDLNRRMQGQVRDGLRQAQEEAGAQVAANAFQQSIEIDVQMGQVEKARADLLELSKLVAEFPALQPNLDEARRTIDGFKSRSTDLLQALRDEFLKGIELRVNADISRANSDIDNITRRLQGEDVELFIKGTPQFQEALARLREVREQGAELERGFKVPVTVQQVGDLSDAQRKKLEDDLKSGKATIQVGPPDITQVADAARQAQIDLDGVARLEKTVTLRIQNAKDVGEIRDALRALEEEFATAEQKAKLDIGQKQVADELAKANEEAKRLASIRVQFLVEQSGIDALEKVRESITRALDSQPNLQLVPPDEAGKAKTLAEQFDKLTASLRDLSKSGTVEARVSGFNQALAALDQIEKAAPRLRASIASMRAEIEQEFRAEITIDVDAERAKRQVEVLADFVRQVAQRTGATSFDLASLDTLSSQLGGATEAADRLQSSLDAVVTSGNPDALLQTYDALGEAIKRSEQGTLDLADSTVAGMERARAKILEALKALEPVQNAHSIAQEIEIDVQLGNFEAAQSKIELLRQQVLQFPNNVAIRLEFENAKQALEEGRASVDEFFAFTRDAVDALNNIAMDGLASALALPFDAMLDDAEDFGARMENLVKDLVRSLIHEFAKLAALRIFRALLGGGALSTFSPEPGDSLSSRTPAPAPPTSKAAAQPAPAPQSVPSAVRVQAPRIVVGALPPVPIEVDLGTPVVEVDPIPVQRLDAPEVRLGPTQPLSVELRASVPPIDVEPDVVVRAPAQESVQLPAPRLLPLRPAVLAAPPVTVGPVAPRRIPAPALELDAVASVLQVPAPVMKPDQAAALVVTPDVRLADAPPVAARAKVLPPDPVDVQLAARVRAPQPAELAPTFHVKHPDPIRLSAPPLAVDEIPAQRLAAPSLTVAAPAREITLPAPALRVQGAAEELSVRPRITAQEPEPVQVAARILPPSVQDLGRMPAVLRPPATATVTQAVRVVPPRAAILPAPDVRIGPARDIALAAPRARVAPLPAVALDPPAIAIGKPREIRAQAPAVVLPPLTVATPDVTVEAPRLTVPPLQVPKLNVDQPDAIQISIPTRVEVGEPEPVVVQVDKPVVPRVRVPAPAVDSQRAAPIRIPAPEFRAAAARAVPVRPVVEVRDPAPSQVAAVLRAPAPLDLGRAEAFLLPPAAARVPVAARLEAPRPQVLAAPGVSFRRGADVPLAAPRTRVAPLPSQVVGAPRITIPRPPAVDLDAPPVRMGPVNLDAPRLNVDAPELVVAPPKVGRVDIDVPIAITKPDVPRPERVVVPIPRPTFAVPRMDAIRVPAPRTLAPVIELPRQARGAVPTMPAEVARATSVEGPRLATSIEQLGRQLRRGTPAPVAVPRAIDLLAAAGTATASRQFDQQRLLAQALRRQSTPMAFAEPATSVFDQFLPSTRSRQFVFSPTIQAMDARSFADWMLDGDGRRGIEEVFASGRGWGT